MNPAADPDSPRAASVDPRLRGRPGWRGWALALVALAGSMAAVWMFQTQIERWILRATFRLVHDKEPKRIDDRLVGRWVSPNGGRILISRSGVVWSEAGDLIGSGSFDAADPSRFSFDGPGFRCLYDLSPKRDVSEWRLLDQTPGAACPEGHFVRAFTF